MKLKSFKRYLREEADQDSFNAFVEDVFNGKWEIAIKEFGNYTDSFHVKDESVIYRILFFRKEEIGQLSRVSDLKRKISGILTSENQGHPRFYTKDDYHNIKDHLSYLASAGMKIHGYTDDSAESIYMGIIISQKTGINDNVDFDNYKKGNTEIRKRIDTTKPVLAINNTNFKVVASMEFDNGWEINEFNNDMNDLSDNGVGQEEEPVEPETDQPEIEGEENVEDSNKKPK
jgi:hypothetical protein